MRHGRPAPRPARDRAGEPHRATSTRSRRPPRPTAALRTSIQFAGLDHKCRSIVVTSSSPGEGKSTTVANFGVVMAQTGSRVCLVDSDLRRPTLHRIFGLDNSRGLTTALLDGVPFAEVAQPTRVPNLFVVTSGPLPPESRPSWSAPTGCASRWTAPLADFDLVVLRLAAGRSPSPTRSRSPRFADGVMLVVQTGKVAARRHPPRDRADPGGEGAHPGRGDERRRTSKRDGYYYDYYRYYQETGS